MADASTGSIREIQLSFREVQLNEALRDGYVIHLLLPAGPKKDVRLAVQDLVTGAAGSITLSLTPNP